MNGSFVACQSRFREVPLQAEGRDDDKIAMCPFSQRVEHCLSPSDSFVTVTSLFSKENYTDRQESPLGLQPWRNGNRDVHHRRLKREAH